MSREPLLHTGITDVLDDSHPLAWTSIYCSQCRELLHASNNENMRSWVETGRGPYCLQCFSAIDDVDGVDEYALPGDDA